MDDLCMEDDNVALYVDRFVEAAFAYANNTRAAGAVYMSVCEYLSANAVCVCVCLCVCVSVCLFVRVCLCAMHLCLHACSMFSCMRACMHAYTNDTISDQALPRRTSCS